MFLSANYIFTEGKRLEALSLKLLGIDGARAAGFEKRRINPRVLIEEIEGLMLPIMENAGLVLKTAAQNAVVMVEPDLFKTLLEPD